MEEYFGQPHDVKMLDTRPETSYQARGGPSINSISCPGSQGPAKSCLRFRSGAGAVLPPPRPWRPAALLLVAPGYESWGRSASPRFALSLHFLRLSASLLGGRSLPPTYPHPYATPPRGAGRRHPGNDRVAPLPERPELPRDHQQAAAGKLLHFTPCVSQFHKQLRSPLPPPP